MGEHGAGAIRVTFAGGPFLSEDMLAHADHAAFPVAHDGLVLDL